jgi:branched-subunit amino acid transport protein
MYNTNGLLALRLLPLRWLQVLATSPFNVFGILCMAWVLYGMAGMRPGWQHVLKAGTVAGLMYLIALQVRSCAQHTQ